MDQAPWMYYPLESSKYFQCTHGWKDDCRDGWQVLSEGVKTTIGWSLWTWRRRGGEMKHHLMPSIVFLFKVKKHDIIGEGKGVY